MKTMEAFELILATLMGGGVFAALVLYLARSWFEARLGAAISFEYQKRFDVFQRQQNQKEKIEIVAELLAEYMKTPIYEPVTREQRVILNKLSLRSFLWLPGDLANELGKRLQNKPDAKSPFHLIQLARQMLTDDTSLKLENITVWGVDKETPNKLPEKAGMSAVPAAKELHQP
jgi:hypothetical protein